MISPQSNKAPSPETAVSLPDAAPGPKRPLAVQQFLRNGGYDYGLFKDRLAWSICCKENRADIRFSRILSGDLSEAILGSTKIVSTETDNPYCPTEWSGPQLRDPDHAACLLYMWGAPGLRSLHYNLLLTVTKDAPFPLSLDLFDLTHQVPPNVTFPLWTVFLSNASTLEHMTAKDRLPLPAEVLAALREQFGQGDAKDAVELPKLQTAEYSTQSLNTCRQLGLKHSSVHGLTRIMEPNSQLDANRAVSSTELTQYISASFRSLKYLRYVNLMPLPDIQAAFEAVRHWGMPVGQLQATAERSARNSEPDWEMATLYASKTGVLSRLEPEQDGPVRIVSRYRDLCSEMTRCRLHQFVMHPYDPVRDPDRHPIFGKPHYLIVTWGDIAAHDEIYTVEPTLEQLVQRVKTGLGTFVVKPAGGQDVFYMYKQQPETKEGQSEEDAKREETQSLENGGLRVSPSLAIADKVLAVDQWVLLQYCSAASIRHGYDRHFRIHEVNTRLSLEVSSQYHCDAKLQDGEKVTEGGGLFDFFSRLLDVDPRDFKRHVVESYVDAAFNEVRQQAGGVPRSKLPLWQVLQARDFRRTFGMACGVDTPHSSRETSSSPSTSSSSSAAARAVPPQAVSFFRELLGGEEGGLLGALYFVDLKKLTVSNVMLTQP